ncbi:hypothetical protein EW146_g3680 [Bondarzewia mesenterica]|uniref:Uncharacterized protein n=1 Tax=Bondarzewia mesenterica TaxID=1095465 RepID=A0A4S4LWV0_9AGAM|nr:hypothetical protein EW146_g3680 [Bondarzewia mesenterica]
MVFELLPLINPNFLSNTTGGQTFPTPNVFACLSYWLFSISSDLANSIMIGRKIMTIREEDFEEDVEPEETAATVVGLTAPKPRKPGLTITTNGEGDTPRSLAFRMWSDTTPTPLKSSQRDLPLSSRTLFTPDTSHTFGRPYPTFRSNPTPVDALDTTARRLHRYSRDEAALVTAIQQCQSDAASAARELKIMVLEQATALLSAKAQDAKERAVELRDRLAESSAIDDQQLLFLQKERWMEEKRTEKVEQERRQLTEYAEALSGSEEKENRYREKEGSGPLEEAEQWRRRLNLATFFERSPTQTSILCHKQSAHEFSSSLPRILSPSDVEAPLLRSWPFADSVKQPIVSSFRPTLSDTSFADPRQLSGNRQRHAKPKLKPLDVFLPISPLRTVEEGVVYEGARSHSVPPTATDSVFPSNATTQTTASSIASECTTLDDEDQYGSAVDLETGETHGFATIFHDHPISRSKEEILAGMQLRQVPMPDYVENLLDEFKQIRGDISLPSLTPRPRLSFRTPTLPELSSHVRLSTDTMVFVSTEELGNSVAYETSTSVVDQPSMLRRSIRIPRTIGRFMQHSHSQSQSNSIAALRIVEEDTFWPEDSGEERRRGASRWSKSFFGHRSHKSEGVSNVVLLDNVSVASSANPQKSSMVSKVRRRMSIFGARA